MQALRVSTQTQVNIGSSIYKLLKNFDKLTKVLLKNCTHFGKLVKKVCPKILPPPRLAKSFGNTQVRSSTSAKSCEMSLLSRGLLRRCNIIPLVSLTLLQHANTLVRSGSFENA